MNEGYPHAVVTLPALSSKRLWLFLAACFFICLLEGFDIAALGVAAPFMVRELRIDVSSMGLAFAAGMVGVLLGSFLFGSLADRVGRKPALLATLVLLGTSSMATAFVTNFATLVVIRLATGLAIGGALPVIIALVAELAPKGRTATFITVVSSGFPLGSIVVATIAALGAVDHGWRVIFSIGGVLPFVVFPLAVRAFPESRALPLPGAAAATLHRALFADGRIRSTLLLGAACVVTQLAFYLLLSWLPLILVAKGIAPSFAPWAVFAFSAGNLLGAPAMGVAVDRWGQRGPTAGGYLVLAVVISLFAVAAQLGPLLMIAFMAGFLVNGVQIALYGIASRYYPQAVRGSGVGAVIGIGRTGSIVGPLAARQFARPRARHQRGRTDPGAHPAARRAVGRAVTASDRLTTSAFGREPANGEPDSGAQ